MNNNNNSSAVKLSSTVEREAILYNSSVDGFLYMASIKAPVYKSDTRSPLDLICVVDRSGSMGGEKINLVKQTLQFVLTQLTSKDRLGVVVYDDIVEVSLVLTWMDEAGKKLATQAISGIQDRGSTNLCGGLVEGIKQMRSRTTKNEVASVLLFTDGLANVGYQTLADIKKAMMDPEYAARNDSANHVSYSAPTQFAYPMQQQIPQQYNMPPMNSWAPNNTYPPVQPYPMQQQQIPQQYVMPPPPTVSQPYPTPVSVTPTSTTISEGKQVPLGCTVNTFGFGGDHDPNLLKGIADHGSGIYYYIKNTDNIPEAFADCLGGLLSVCGQNISLKFEAQNNATIKQVITKFKTTTITPGQSIEVSIGDIQSDEQKDILVSTTLPTLSYQTDSFSIGKVTLTYFNVIDSKMEVASTDVILSRPATLPPNMKPNVELNKQHNRLLAAEAMEKATEAGNSGRLEEGRKILNSAISRIKESISANDEFCKGLITDLLKCAESLRDQHTYQNVGQQMLNNNFQAHYHQRSSNVAMASQMAYQTPSRMMQQANFSALKHQ